jgi:ribonuclease E
MKRTLISVQDTQTKIAMTLDGKLIDLHIDSADIKLQKSNIYMGRISHIEPSLNAVFVNYGDTKDAFLPMKDIAEEYFVKNGVATDLKVNQNVIIQVNKDKRGTKGAYVTTFVSLAGCYIIFMPNSLKAKPGISKRIQEKDRERIKDILAHLTLPEEGKVVTRSASIYATTALIQAEISALMLQWINIKEKAQQNTNIGLLHQEDTLAARIMREYLIEETQSVVIDNKDIFQSLKNLLKISRPVLAKNIHLFNHSNINIFQHYGVEQTIKSIFDRKIPLKSGGSIVIDNTEALIAIDVNSAKSTGHKNIEETALNTNIEAVVAIADQLRFRSISGLIVVDLIDMSLPENRLLIEEKFVESMSQDRARIQMTRISKLGLIEISRQNLSPAVRDTLMLTCGACAGLGRVPSDRSATLSLINSIEAHLQAHPAPAITVKVAQNIAIKVIEQHLAGILEIERTYKTRVLFIGDPNDRNNHISINGIYNHEIKASVVPPVEQKSAVIKLKHLMHKLGEFIFGADNKKASNTVRLDNNRVKVVEMQTDSIQVSRKHAHNQTSVSTKEESNVVPQTSAPKIKVIRKRAKNKIKQDNAVIVTTEEPATPLHVSTAILPKPAPQLSTFFTSDDAFIEVETKKPDTP